MLNTNVYIDNIEIILVRNRNYFWQIKRELLAINFLLLIKTELYFGLNIATNQRPIK